MVYNGDGDFYTACKQFNEPEGVYRQNKLLHNIAHIQGRWKTMNKNNEKTVILPNLYHFLIFFVPSLETCQDKKVNRMDFIIQNLSIFHISSRKTSNWCFISNMYLNLQHLVINATLKFMMRYTTHFKIDPKCSSA